VVGVGQLLVKEFNLLVLLLNVLQTLRVVPAQLQPSNTPSLLVGLNEKKTILS